MVLQTVLVHSPKVSVQGGARSLKKQPFILWQVSGRTYSAVAVSAALNLLLHLHLSPKALGENSALFF